MALHVNRTCRAQHPSNGQRSCLDDMEYSTAAGMKKRVALSLAPGWYLVSADPEKTRVWATDGAIVEGHGSRLRRATLATLFKKLNQAADREDAAIERRRRRYSKAGNR